MQWGWTTATDILYRWDGHALARVWRADVALDNRMADDRDVPQPYREDYQAEWEWVDLDGDGSNEILLRDQVTFHPANGDDSVTLGEGAWERAFRWDGVAFRPYVPDGMGGVFAYTVLGDLWLWQDHTARPLGVRHVREIDWSPDGLSLAWWAQPPAGEGSDSQNAVLGIYDLATGDRQEFSLEEKLSALHWAPDGRLAYAFSDRPFTLLDPKTGQQESLPDAPLGAWSPDGSRMAYERDGALYIYDLSAGRERPLVVAPEGTVAPVVLPSPAWSPRGDWIACYLAYENATWVGLVAPDLSEPLSSFTLLGTFEGKEASELQYDWASDGSRLAVLATDPRLAPQPTVLYLARTPAGGNGPVGHPEWQNVLQLETVIRTAEFAWSPCGDRVALAIGNEVWEVTASGETTLRHRFSVPDPEWTVLEWAPNGSGFLAGLDWVYDEHLYWFPADGTDVVLLLADSIGAASWAPQIGGTPDCPGAEPTMVLIEHTDNDPLFHFVGGDGSYVIVSAMGEAIYTPFQIGGDRVYYDYRYAHRSGVTSLLVPDVSGSCHPPLVSPNGRWMAWLCDDGPPDMSALMDGTEEIHFQLIVTDGEGHNPREVWSYTEMGPDYRDIQPISWRADGEVIYMSQPKYGAAWAYFDYNPGILALDVNTGRVTQIGDLDGVHDGLVSPDGTWIVQSRIEEWPNEGVTVILRSLIDGTERSVACAEGATVAGDFSFSPDNVWLAWREWVRIPGGSMLLVRVLNLPDGEPLTVYGDAERTAPQIGGWLKRDDLVMVYPVQEDGTGGHSAVVTLPSTGSGDVFSPFVFLGVLGEAP